MAKILSLEKRLTAEIYVQPHQVYWLAEAGLEYRYVAAKMRIRAPKGNIADALFFHMLNADDSLLHSVPPKYHKLSPEQQQTLDEALRDATGTWKEYVGQFESRSGVVRDLFIREGEVSSSRSPGWRHLVAFYGGAQGIMGGYSYSSRPREIWIEDQQRVPSAAWPYLYEGRLPLVSCSMGVTEWSEQELQRTVQAYVHLFYGLKKSCVHIVGRPKKGVFLEELYARDPIQKIMTGRVPDRFQWVNDFSEVKYEAFLGQLDERFARRGRMNDTFFYEHPQLGRFSLTLDEYHRWVVIEPESSTGLLRATLRDMVAKHIRAVMRTPEESRMPEDTGEVISLVPENK